MDKQTVKEITAQAIYVKNQEEISKINKKIVVEAENGNTFLYIDKLSHSVWQYYKLIGYNIVQILNRNTSYPEEYRIEWD